MFNDKDLGLLGSRLKELRQASGATAAEIARDVLGYENGSHVAVTRLERGILARPRRDHLEALATFYGVAASYLLVEKCEEAEGERAETPEVVKPAAPAKAKSKSPRLATVGARVQHVREAAGQTEGQFATALCAHGAIITSTNVKAWEADETVPNPIQLRALSKLTERSDEWFLEGTDTRGRAAPASTGFWVTGSVL